MKNNDFIKPPPKQTEDNLESELENGFEVSSQVLLAGEATVVLDRKSRIMGSNETARRLFSQEMMPGEHFLLETFLQGPYLTEAQSALDNALGKGEGTQNLPASAEDAQGNSFNCLYSANPIFGPGKQVIGVLLCFLDADYVAIQPRPFTDPDLLLQMPTLCFESLLEQMAEGIFTINSRWRIISFNQTAERITGYQRNEVLGRFCWEIFRSDLCQSDCPLRLTLETGLTRLDQDVRMLDKKGTKLPVLVNTSVLRDRSGLVIGAVESFRPLMEMQGNLDSSPHKLFPSDIIGKSAPMTRIFQMLPDLAARDATDLVQGESGKGKELIPRAVHNQF